MKREAWVVVDLGFGDGGKGTVTDFLVRDRAARLVVRYNGGAQAGHNVVTADGTHHTFAQFGAGSFVPGTATHLGPDFVLHPGGMWVEAEALARAGVGDALLRTTVDERALLVSPFQQAAGRLREIDRGSAEHGTTGVGLGEAVADARAGHDDTLRALDLRRPKRLLVRLRRQQERKRHELRCAADRTDPRAAAERDLLEDPDAVERILAAWKPLRVLLRVVTSDQARALIEATETVIFEGAQGVLLDQTWGFHPHTTWSDCTPRGALRLLEGLDAAITRLGVIRSYATRHGRGPFPTADTGHRKALPEPHNDAPSWQGEFRSGPLDVVLLRYALGVCGATGGMDALAVTCLDRLGESATVCVAYTSATADDAPPVLALSDAGGSAKMLTRLVCGEPDDIDHRRRLGLLLDRVQPVYTSIARAAFLPTVEATLGVAVALESFGPTAGDKRWRAGVSSSGGLLSGR